MRGFYNITERIRLQLATDEFVNTVTYGDIFRVDLKKQTLFPLSHVVVNNATMENNVWRYNISIMAMDIVDISKVAVPATAQGVFRGNDNEQDVLNTQFAVLNRLLEILRSGDIRNELYQLDGNPTLEPFTERFENFLAGWVATFDVLIPNDMTSCDATADPSAICDAASYTLVDTLGNNLASGTISSGGTLEIEAPDATATIKNTAGTTIATEAIPSGATEIVTITDSALTINSASIGSVAAEASLDIVVNLDGAPSGSWDGNSWEVTSAQILAWELNYNGTDDVIFIVGSVGNVGTLASGSGMNVGTITVSTDGVTYGALSFPFTPIALTTYYFKRSTATVTGAYAMVGTYV